ncbi:uncharacterized protein BDZ99DRAFT_467372 [Mytilinidion resinicola]|uniref:Uncharacterized protein n=1 Tax=Mytilinidion resinicola TaxID=574789 RepID=A0A6A6YA36_9PEZI|nr:uncharacterized protein BDZ99DRAFT_467372 [Mytilinidion resinicola]KAF2804687.1 hypothetical protein BDZ99DRAFT_467372 [Mytilinidion resinicola]
MADVRSLLRQERAARQQATKPARSTRTSAAPATAPVGKKRKAVDDEPETRKRTKAEEATGLPSGFFDGGATEEARAASPTEEQDTLKIDAGKKTLETIEPLVVPVADEPAPVADEVDEELWAAFERDVATPPPEKHFVPALAAAATIQAAPVSAAELAAQAREDMSAQRGRRDAEIEAEKEDAARQLEDEFEELEGWEERARKLREKREALRKARDLSAPPVQEIVAPPVEASEDEDSEDDFEEDGWGDWGVRAA